MNCLAFDIGGAQIKIADGRGYAVSEPFPLWQTPELLTDKLRAMIEIAPQSEMLAVTMTGELADCFTTRSEGVRFILDAVQSVAAQRKVRVYLTDGTFVSIDAANQAPLKAAAANWHALAKFAARFAAEQGSALLIDIGSTTTDIIPIENGQVAALGLTDKDRLASGELVYTGVERTAIAAIVSELYYRGAMIPVAAELFATTRDVYLTLGDLPEEPDCTRTANGKPAAREASRDRLARMLCLDRDDFEAIDAQFVAEHVQQEQIAKIEIARRQVLSRFKNPPQTILTSGQGEFLANRILEKFKVISTVVSLSNKLGSAVSHCAPAHALAVLALESSEGRES